LGDGQQPPEATISNICDAFGCTIPEAKAMDWAEVRDVLEYRTLYGAKDQHNRDISKMTPGQATLWIEMLKAAGVTGNDGG
jgi:hypothetical protein